MCTILAICSRNPNSLFDEINEYQIIELQISELQISEL